MGWDEWEGSKDGMGGMTKMGYIVVWVCMGEWNELGTLEVEESSVLLSSNSALKSVHPSFHSLSVLLFCKSVLMYIQQLFFYPAI